MSPVRPSVPVDVEKLNTLIEINTRINSSYSDVNALLVYILESAMRLVRCESASLLMVQDDDTLRFSVALGPKGVEALAVPVKSKGSIAGWVVENNKPLIIDDVPNDPRYYSNMQNKTGYLTRTMIAVPLRVKGKCIGVIELLNKAEQQLFSQSDLEILELLCVQASTAYQNADTYLQARNEIKELQSAISARSDYHTFVAESAVILDLLKVIERIAQTTSSVLILGESGVGKELFAEQLHLKSERSKKAFVRVNCAALSPQLLESELFGHVKGAYTDAVSNRKGRFEIADGGTIFLDEVGELPLDLQAKLLRVIQERTFERVGSSDTISVNVRIIAATNRNLEEMVKEGRFRNDLYFRLNVLPVNIPPLRERKEDILPLANYFMQKADIDVKRNFTSISQEAQRMLLAYQWPGNVRELQNAIERACVLGTPPFIEANDLQLVGKKAIAECSIENFSSEGEVMPLKIAINRFKKKYVTSILKMNNWNQTKTAKLLDIQRTYVSRLMNELDIQK